MKEIYNSRTDHPNRVEGIKVYRGRKYLTLQYRTAFQGMCDMDLLYPLEVEGKLLDTLLHPLCDIHALTEYGWGPKPIKITKRLVE